MACIVMRVRFTSGDQTDVTFEDREAQDDHAVIERALAALREDSGVLRCSHGDRLVLLFARGVASVEVAPRGANL